MNFGRLRALAVKEARQIWRDPRSLMIALLLPIMQMMLLGYGVNLDVKHLPLCIYDRESSQQSNDLVTHFRASAYFSIVEFDHDYGAVRAALDAARCNAALVIPPDFSIRVTDSGSADVQALVDGTDANTANLAIGYLQAVVAAFSSNVEVLLSGKEGSSAIMPAAATQSRVWFNEDLASRDFVIPGVCAVILAIVGAQLTSLTISREWERGTMEALISTPVRPMEVMLGKLAPYFIIGLVDAAICLATAVWWFEVPFRGTLIVLFATTALYLVVVLGIGYLVSTLVRSQVGASQVALLLTMMPTTLLSGFSFPIDQMPPLVQAVTYIVSARYYVTILKSVFLKGSGFGELVVPVAALALYAAVIALLAARAFRKRLA